MGIPIQYGQSPLYFGGEDYNKAKEQGYTDAEILAWMNANKDKLQGANVPGGGGLYDNVQKAAAASTERRISTEYGATADYFGREDYNQAKAKGFTDAEILDWMNRNTDKIQPANAPGGGGLYDSISKAATPATPQEDIGAYPQQQLGAAGGVYYSAKARQWNITKEKTDYKTDYPTNAFTGRKTDYVTNLPSYPLPAYLPTDLPINLSTTLPTNLKTDYPTNLPTNLQKEEVYYVTQTSYGRGGGTFRVRKTRMVDDTAANNRNREENQKNANLNAQNSAQNQTNARLNVENVTTNTRNYETNLRNSTQNLEIQKERNRIEQINSQNASTNAQNTNLNNNNRQLNEQAQKLNENNTLLNTDNTQLNRENTAKNNLYTKTVGIASSTKGGDYVNQRDQITFNDLVNAGMSASDAKEVIDGIQAQFKRFYQNEKLQYWDTELGAKPPYGTFDPLYYKGQNPTVDAAWQKAVAMDDIDITERYGQNNYYWQHYTSIGKGQGLRGNKEEDLIAAQKYIEKALTDQEIQSIRDLQLGVDSDTITQRLLNVPEVSNEWTKARQGDAYWKDLAKQKYLDVNKPEEFAVLFRLSERPEDKQIILSYNINAGSGITELEDAINTAINTKKTVEIKKFAALNQTILKDAIAEMKKQRGQQEMMAFFRGFEGFTEVMDINQEIANSILGDTGVGGILSITSGKKGEESLLNSLQNVTGMRNNVVYNWQQWFDKSIKEKYGIDYSLFEPLEEKRDIVDAFLNSAEKPYDATKSEFNAKFLEDAGFTTTKDLLDFLNKQGPEGQTILTAIQGDPGDSAKLVLQPILSRLDADIKTLDESKQRGLALAYSTGEETGMMNIEAQYARNYIDEYLIPRFNTSKSMDEFIELLDTRQEERNPFEMTDIDQTLKQLGQLHSQVYLDQVKQQGPRSFDPEFYFNPTGDRSRLTKYADQKQAVEEDWEKAKAGDPYWASQVYRFGIDVNNKAAFARMHFEVKGQGQGYDAADDITNASKVQDFISINVMPILQKEADKAEVVFGTFITPEEFADEMLRGLDPAKTPEAWNEVLQRFKLTDFKGTTDELRNYIIETLRGNSAQEIREQIKFLNEKREKPTQEILGITYIPKEGDYVEQAIKPTTQLYAIFQNAGYKGTEDDFYENMFPDLDRTEQVLLTKAGTSEGLKMEGFDFRDPFGTLSKMEGFFPDEEGLASEDISEATRSSVGESFYTRYLKIKDEEETKKAEDTTSTPDSFLSEYKSLFNL